MPTDAPPERDLERLRAVIRGAVQGVGFRPFVHRLATEMCLAGWVSNGNEGVVLEVEGPLLDIRQFLTRLTQEKPTHAVIHSLEPVFLDSIGHAGFSIRESGDHGVKTAFILPDIATCADCLKEIFHPSNRRYQYPFTNCTHCGPRYSLIEDLPYDRARTTMKMFAMCPDCEWEYHNPQDRRFHAQPTACPTCGPQLALWDRDGKTLTVRHDALLAAAGAIMAGQVVAIKGLGGFHLCVDARSENAVQTLRQRKHRQEKPFAIMMPSIESIRALCEVSAMEERLLTSAEAPIVLLRRRSTSDALLGGIADSVAPGNPYLGVMLPYTPLHHLLMKEFPFPMVATSGNVSEEPICTDESSALHELNGLADFFLVHNRPIARPVDDSVVAVVEGRELMIRRSRGYAPLPIHLGHMSPKVLAVGAHLKNSVAIAIDDQAFISQHIGELETARAFETFKKTIDSFEQLYEFTPDILAYDLHPNYVSTHYAGGRQAQMHPVQHHYAHVLSCMADNDLEGPVLGVAWDGTGYGLDHTVWGGEFLHVTATGFERAAHLRTFRLPGNEKAVREPRRSALGLLFEMFGEWVFDGRNVASLKAFSAAELSLLEPMLKKGIQTPITSSAGRLFDAVASLLDLRHTITFEGQAAMELEFAATGHESEGVYPFEMADWEPMIHALLKDFQRSVAVGAIAARFHHTLVEMIIAVARSVGEKKVVLTGGCFQNRYLTSRAIRRLKEEGFQPYWHQRIPPNDGGISLGQIVAVTREFSGKEPSHVSGRPR
jgi:hydrogenase maturation protein HypF